MPEKVKATGKTIKLAVNGGIGFGSKLNAKQLLVMAISRRRSGTGADKVSSAVY